MSSRRAFITLLGVPSEREVAADRAMEAWYHPSIA